MPSPRRITIQLLVFLLHCINDAATRLTAATVSKGNCSFMFRKQIHYLLRVRLVFTLVIVCMSVDASIQGSLYISKSVKRTGALQVLAYTSESCD